MTSTNFMIKFENKIKTLQTPEIGKEINEKAAGSLFLLATIRSRGRI